MIADIRCAIRILAKSLAFGFGRHPDDRRGAMNLDAIKPLART